MTVVYLPSLSLTGGLPDHWEIADLGGAGAGDYGLPTVSGGVIHFDWSEVPNTVQNGTCGLVRSGVLADAPTFYEYDLRIPSGLGKVAFTVTMSTGTREQTRFTWQIGDLAWRIDMGQFFNRQLMTSTTTGDGAFVEHPWTGSCSYLLWYPSGLDHEARLDFDGGSITIPMSATIDGNVQFVSGGSSTTGPPGFPLPGPPDAKAATCDISGLTIESWDPTAGAPFGYPWAVAVDGEWHGTYNQAALSYYDTELDEIAYTWSWVSAQQRLGS